MAIITHYSSLINYNAATFTSCVRFLILEVAKYEQEDGSIKNILPVSCAESLTRLLEFSAKIQNKTMAYYIITDYIKLLSKQSLSNQTKKAIIPGIYQLINICSKEDEEYLFSSLVGEMEQQLIKDLLSDYRKNFQYKGKF